MMVYKSKANRIIARNASLHCEHDGYQYQLDLERATQQLLLRHLHL